MSPQKQKGVRPDSRTPNDLEAENYPDWLFYGIRSLIGFCKLESPIVHSVLYHHDKSSEASPKAISDGDLLRL